jgi:uncharacterized protein YjcR
MLGESEKVVAVWKQRDGWANVVQQTNERRTTNTAPKTRKAGAPRGNKNAVGNRGGPGGPPGNKKAVVTGEYETIYLDALDEEERVLFAAVDTDIGAQLDREIRLLEIRERRMLQRIKRLQDGPEMVSQFEDHSEQSSELHGNTDIHNERREAALDRIQRIEEALTRVQERKAKLLDLKHKVEKGTGPDDSSLADLARAIRESAES